MKFIKVFNTLCTPAQLYLGMSILSVLAMCYQNIGNPNSFACGFLKADTPINNVFYIIFQILYVIGWTYLLNLFCKKGLTKLSWLLVLFPFIAMFIVIGLTILALKNYN